MRHAGFADTLRPVNEPTPPPPTQPPQPEDPSSGTQVRWLLRMALVFYGVVVLFAIGLALFTGSIGSLFGDKAPNPGNLLAGLGVGLAIVAVTRVGFRAWPTVQRAAREFSNLIGPIGLKEALLLATVSAFAEELLFRGALFEPLGLFGTTGLFAVVHIVPTKTLWWRYPIFAFAAGLFLGLLREGTGSVIPPMIAHFVVNAINLYWLGSKHAAWAAEAVAPPAPPSTETPPSAPEVEPGA